MEEVPISVLTLHLGRLQFAQLGGASKPKPGASKPEHGASFSGNVNGFTQGKFNKETRGGRGSVVLKL